jgi:hypothetical protein
LADEVKELISLGEIPDTIQVNNTEDTKEIEWIKVNYRFLKKKNFFLIN